MPMTHDGSRDEDDQQQVVTLCDTLESRVETMRTEQQLLADLVTRTARTRPYRSRQYALLLDEVRGRYQRARALVMRFCHLH